MFYYSILYCVIAYVIWRTSKTGGSENGTSEIAIRIPCWLIPALRERAGRRPENRTRPFCSKTQSGETGPGPERFGLSKGILN